MKRFEYKFETIEFTLGKPNDLVTILNGFGDEGWELVQWQFMSDSTLPLDANYPAKVLATFKREKCD